jgi:hypothetical protein
MEALEVAVPGGSQHRAGVVMSELKGMTVVLAVLPDNLILKITAVVAGAVTLTLLAKLQVALAVVVQRLELKGLMEIGMPLAAGVVAVLVVLVVLPVALRVPVKAVLELLATTKAKTLLPIPALVVAEVLVALEIIHPVARVVLV